MPERDVNRKSPQSRLQLASAILGLYCAMSKLQSKAAVMEWIGSHSLVMIWYTQ